MRGRPVSEKKSEDELVSLVVLVPRKTKKWLQQAAERQNKSVGQYVREILGQK